MTNKTRIAVAGAGLIGKRHIDLAAKSQRGQLSAIVDPAPAAIEVALSYNVPLYSSFKQIRSKKPDTPIVLVEDRRNTNSWILPARDAHHTDNHAALKNAFEMLQSESVHNLLYIRGDNLYGTDGDGATDGSHANDLGFFRQADVFEPVLRKALGR